MYRPEQTVLYCTHYQPQDDGSCKQTVYKVLISNVVDGRSLYREYISFDAFRTRELTRAYPNKHRKIEWVSIDREDEWLDRQATNERVGLPRQEIFKEVGPTWWHFFDEIGYDRKKKKYVNAC